MIERLITLLDIALQQRQIRWTAQQFGS